MESPVKIDDLEVPLFFEISSSWLLWFALSFLNPKEKTMFTIYRYSNHVAMNGQDGKTPTDAQGDFFWMPCLLSNTEHVQCASLIQISSSIYTCRPTWANWGICAIHAIHAGCSQLHPWKLTWNLKITQWKRNIIFRISLLGFHVSFRGCIHFLRLVQLFISKRSKNTFWITDNVLSENPNSKKKIKKWWQIT